MKIFFVNFCVEIQAKKIEFFVWDFFVPKSKPKFCIRFQAKKIKKLYILNIELFVVGMMFHTFFATLICTSLSTVFGVLVVLRNDPWFDPQYLIPTVGMLLGNSLMALSVGLDRCLSAFSEGRDTVEVYLFRKLLA